MLLIAATPGSCFIHAAGRGFHGNADPSLLLLKSENSYYTELVYKHHPKNFCQFTTSCSTRNLRNTDQAKASHVSQLWHETFLSPIFKQLHHVAIIIDRSNGDLYTGIKFQHGFPSQALAMVVQKKLSHTEYRSLLSDMQLFQKLVNNLKLLQVGEKTQIYYQVMGYNVNGNSDNPCHIQCFRGIRCSWLFLVHEGLTLLHK